MSAWARVQDSLAGSRGRFLDSLRRAGTAQREQLRSIVHANRETAFGHAHGFAAPEEFRDRVPVRAYADFEPWIARVAAGEPGVLTCDAPVVFEETGGSASGPKLIPYTASGLAAFRRALAAWLDDLLAARPGIAAGRCSWAISPAGRPRRQTPGGVPIGMESDAAYFGPAIASEIAALLAAPPEVAAAPDLEVWRSLTLRHLSQARDLTLISIWSPTFLLSLLADLEPAAALWPHLDTISCWTSASSAAFARELRSRFPGVFLQGKGLLATEGVVTIPLQKFEYPVLAVDSGFYEFLDEQGRLRLCEEVTEGETYRVVLTTHSGLYRYELGDRVRVRGWAEAAPMLEFIGRAGLVSDLCGEKLTEEFVLGCLTGLPGFALLAPSLDGIPHYALFVESAGEDLAGRIDTALSANPQYAYARRLGQLGPLAVHRVPRAMQRYCARETARGRRLGDIKPPALSNRPGWESVFAR